MLKKLLQSFLKPAPTGNFRAPEGTTIVPMREPTKLPCAEPPDLEYPVECLGPRLQDVVRAITRMTQAPSAIAAQSVLAVVSLTFGSRFKVETLAPSATNAASYFVLVAASGERKSAADGLAMAGVKRTVLEMRAEHKCALEAHERAVAGLERGADRPSPPVCPSFLVTEPTIEGAFKVIESGAGLLGWFTDEAASFWGGHSMAKEKQGLTSACLSKLWDGDSSSRPRATQAGDGYVPPTPTTVNLMFQPMECPH